MPKASVTRAELPSSLKVGEKKGFSIAAHLDTGEAKLAVGVANRSGNPGVVHLVVEGQDVTVPPGKVRYWYFRKPVASCTTGAVSGKIYFPAEGEYKLLVVGGCVGSGWTDRQEAAVTVESKKGILASIPTWGWVAGGVVGGSIVVGLIMREMRHGAFPRPRLPRRRAYPPVRY